MPKTPRRPVITLTTDFGLTDSYVAQMKGRILAKCPNATLVDVTHLVPRHDLLAGSIALERALAAFGRGTVHVAVVDPGVGSDRKLLVANVAGQTVLCPDNGLMTWPIRRSGKATVRELKWRPRTHSSTFHGRDIIAPVAAMIATGNSQSIVGEAFDPMLLDFDVARELSGVVIHVDVYGNAMTNIPADVIGTAKFATIGRRKVLIRRTYADVSVGKPLALIGSSDLLEIAIREGSAADVLRVRVGDKVTLQ